MSKWIAEFELEDGDIMPEHMDLEYKGVRIDFHCRPLEQEPRWIPVNDRLPEGNDTDRVLVCYANGFITIHSVGRLRSTKDFVCEVAWMPLPKAFGVMVDHK